MEPTASSRTVKGPAYPLNSKKETPAHTALGKSPYLQQQPQEVTWK